MSTVGEYRRNAAECIELAIVITDPTRKLAIIDMEELQKFAEPGDIEALQALQQQVEDYIREQAEKQGLEGDGAGKYRLSWRMTPRAR